MNLHFNPLEVVLLGALWVLLGLAIAKLVTNPRPYPNQRGTGRPPWINKHGYLLRQVTRPVRQ